MYVPQYFIKLKKHCNNVRIAHNANNHYLVVISQPTHTSYQSSQTSFANAICKRKSVRNDVDLCGEFKHCISSSRESRLRNGCIDERLIMNAKNIWYNRVYNMKLNRHYILYTYSLDYMPEPLQSRILVDSLQLTQR